MSQIRKSYEFASVGEIQTEFENRLVDPSAGVPVGIKTPMELSYGDVGPFKTHSNLGDQIKDNFRNMLATNHGDRLMLCDFGANLEELTFELTTDDADAQAVNRIRKTTEKYMPFISLDTFEPFKEHDESGVGLALVGVRIIYSVPSINLNNQAVEIVLYNGG